jgi:hypothetical protein
MLLSKTPTILTNTSLPRFPYILNKVCTGAVTAPSYLHPAYFYAIMRLIFARDSTLYTSLRESSGRGIYPEQPDLTLPSTLRITGG